MQTGKPINITQVLQFEIPRQLPVEYKEEKIVETVKTVNQCVSAGVILELIIQIILKGS